MNQRRAQFWVWWLLPFLAMRALVPAGFMTDAADHFRLVMCSEGVNLKTEELKTIESTFGGTNPQDHHNTGHQSATHTPCLFAGSALPPLTAGVHGSMSLHVDYVSALAPILVKRFTNQSDAAHAIRGPPAFS